MEREIQLLKQKVQELSEENVALREINIQFQLTNFKLQQAIKKLENNQFEEVPINEVEGASKTSLNFDPLCDETAEYLEEPVKRSAVNKRSCDNISIRKSKRSAKRKKEKELIESDSTADDDDDDQQVKPESDDFEAYEIIVEEETKRNDFDIGDDDNSPKEAAKIVYLLAAKRGNLDRLKLLEKGKHKDSSFVTKILDLFFDRETLAYSSVKGQKCQSLFNLEARPPLDPKKLHICQQAFIHRLQSEDLDPSAFGSRVKAFNTLVNFKIQNARKILNKKK